MAAPLQDCVTFESPCNCPAQDGPFFCEQHQQVMNPTQWRECKSRCGFYEVFDEQRRIREATDGKIRGLGDVVQAFTRMTGIEAVVDYINARLRPGKPCGCSKRREVLNEAVPFSRRSEEE